MKVPIDECPAGPAMDAAVAKALGWVKVECDGIYYWSDPSVDEWHTDRIASIYSTVGHKLEGAIVWSPSTDIAAAEELWNKLVEEHWVMSVCYGPGRDGSNYASVQMQLDKFLITDLMTRNPTDMDAKAETKPLAISRAFLKAKGIEYVEVP